MSTERRRNAGGRRRATGPAGEAAGNDGRHSASEDDGFWDDVPERRFRRSRGDHDDERPQRRRSEAARAGAAAEGGRRAKGERGSRRATHGARSEGTRRAAASGRGGGGRRRPPSREGGNDDRGPVKRFFSKVWKPALVTAGLLFILGVVAFGVAYARTPNPSELDAQAEAELASTSVQYADGTEAVTTGELNRVPVSSEDIPQSVINGVLGSEQRNFYEEPGISITGTMRAVLTGGQAGGGSTITQQMARNYYGGLSQERSYLRKINEILISIKVGQQLQPDEILTQYLNTIYFGRDAYGIQAAAQAYFDKDVSDLNEAEGAFIGAIIQQPSNFQNVEADPEMQAILEDRWQYAVDGMVEMNEDDPELGIPRSEADKLEFPEPVPYEPGENLSGHKGYIKTAVESELKRRYDLELQDVATGGYRVTTSLEEDLMKAAHSAFADTLPDMPEETLMGLAAVDPNTGQVRAFHGGTDFATQPNNSLTHRTQAGSAFKPYVLATGLDQGIGLKSTFDGDSPQAFPGVEEEIQNNEDRSYGEVDLIESTADSVNTSYVELAVQTTPEAVVETAKKSGVKEEQFETAAMGPNIALGTHQLTALDQAVGYATFANEGVHMPPHMVTEVEDSEGEVLEPKDASKLEAGDQAFSADIAADATHAMTQVIENGGGENAALQDGRPAAGKTGTSNDAKSAWFVGYTPQLSAAVSLSRDDGEQLVIPGVNDVYGGTTSARIWNAFMTEAMEGEEVEQFPRPAWVGDEQNFMPEPSPSPSPSPEPSQEPSPEPSLEPTLEPSRGPSPPVDECNPVIDPECEEDDDDDDGGDDPPGDDDDGGGGGFPWNNSRD